MRHLKQRVMNDLSSHFSLPYGRIVHCFISLFYYWWSLLFLNVNLCTNVRIQCSDYTHKWHTQTMSKQHKCLYRHHAFLSLTGIRVLCCYNLCIILCAQFLKCWLFIFSKSHVAYCWQLTCIYSDNCHCKWKARTPRTWTYIENINFSYLPWFSLRQIKNSTSSLSSRLILCTFMV
jgi:hypothetical protein